MRIIDTRGDLIYQSDMGIQQTRKSTNLTLDIALLKEAKSLKVNLSRAAEDGIRQALLREREALWMTENREALESSNDFVEHHGVPMASHRQF